MEKKCEMYIESSLKKPLLVADDIFLDVRAESSLC